MMATTLSIPQSDMTLPESEPEADTSSSNKVRFAADLKLVIPSLSLDEYSDLELQQCFYSSNDRYRIESERKTIISRMEKEFAICRWGHEKKQKMPSCCRGLENLTEEGSMQSQNRIWEVIDTVMNEQRDQRNRKIYDSERIASASQSVSTESTVLALRFAILDQEAAFKVYQNWAVRNPVVFAATTA